LLARGVRILRYSIACEGCKDIEIFHCFSVLLKKHFKVSIELTLSHACVVVSDYF